MLRLAYWIYQDDITLSFSEAIAYAEKVRDKPMPEFTRTDLVLAIMDVDGCGYSKAFRAAEEILKVDLEPNDIVDYCRRLRKAKLPFRAIPGAIELAFGQRPSISMIHRWLNLESAQRHRDREAERYRDNL